MKAKELRDLSVDELSEKEQGLKHELFNLSFQKATGELSNTAMLGKTKRNLARVKTILREKAIPEGGK
ncbi:MAG: 50S ribosomal protein L29 [Pseudomonadota bacterium]